MDFRQAQVTTTEDPSVMRAMSRIRKIRPIEKTAREIRVPNHCLAYLCVRRNNWRSKVSAQFGVTRKERPHFFWLLDRFLWFILTCVESDEQEAKNPGKSRKMRQLRGNQQCFRAVREES